MSDYQNCDGIYINVADEFRATLKAQESLLKQLKDINALIYGEQKNG